MAIRTLLSVLLLAVTATATVLAVAPVPSGGIPLPADANPAAAAAAEKVHPAVAASTPTVASCSTARFSPLAHTPAASPVVAGLWWSQLWVPPALAVTARWSDRERSLGWSLRWMSRRAW